ncbi:hypothetical protein MMC22_000406 [Lobaria immixta]|nr:hypothetical protein [Lobaria immixta]
MGPGSSLPRGNLSTREEYPRSNHKASSFIQECRLFTSSLPSSQQELGQTGNKFKPQDHNHILPPNTPEFQNQEHNVMRSRNRTGNGHNNSTHVKPILSSCIKGSHEIAVHPMQNDPRNDRYGVVSPLSAQTRESGQNETTSHAEIVLGADGKPTGLVRFIGDHMGHQEVSGDCWKQAIYHEELRGQLIAEASLLGEYDHPRERGIANNDVTSFLPSQRDWGPDRDLHWPKIKDNVLHRFERNEYPILDYKQEVWFHAGKIALDLDNHAILKYHVLPATLSSVISGRDMEAMKRLNLRIGRKDFRARVPSARF